MSRQRAAILGVLRRDKSHHTAEEILALAAEACPGISRATVYNSLKYLEENKFIRRISGEGRTARYDGSYIPHGHAICEVCGRVWDFEIPTLGAEIASALGSDFDSYELKVRALCEECRIKKTGGKSAAVL